MPGLDSAPPLPPNLGGAPAQPSLSGLAGQGQQAPAGGDPSAAAGGGLQKAVIEQLMLAEGALQQAAQLLPQLAPVVDGIVQQLRPAAGRILASVSQPQGAAPAAGAVMPTAPMMGA